MHISISDDYCSLTVKISGVPVNFYYGYEEQDENGEWLFVVTCHGRRIAAVNAAQLKLTARKLSIEEVFLRGIGKLIEDGHLKLDIPMP